MPAPVFDHGRGKPAPSSSRIASSGTGYASAGSTSPLRRTCARISSTSLRPTWASHRPALIRPARLSRDGIFIKLEGTWRN